MAKRVWRCQRRRVALRVGVAAVVPVEGALICLGYMQRLEPRHLDAVIDAYRSGEPDEIIVRVMFPLPKKAAYIKFRNQASRYALVGVFAAKRPSDVRVAVTGAGSNGVFRLTTFEEALKKRFSHKVLDGLAVPAEGLNSDLHGSAEYRAHLIAVLTRRAVEAATAKA